LTVIVLSDNLLEMESAMGIRSSLGAVPLFSDALDAQQLDALASAARMIAFGAGASIIRENDVGRTMYVIASGTVAVSIDDAAGSRPVATLTSGQIFGEISLLTGLPRLGTVVAVTEVKLIEVTKAMLQPILADAPKLYDRMAALLAKRQGDLDQIVDPAFWSQFGRSRESLSKVMRRNFEGVH
jgi:CRP-like cAMP-binding protein